MIGESDPKLRLPKGKNAINLQQSLGNRSYSYTIPFILEKRRDEWYRNRKPRNVLLEAGMELSQVH